MEIEIKPATLKQVSKQYKLLSVEVNYFDAVMPKQKLGDNESFKIHQAFVCLGRLENVHIFGRNFVLTQDGRYVFNCQSYQNVQEYNLQESFQYYIASRGHTLFKENIEEECIFIGGMALECHDGEPTHNKPGSANFGHFIFEYLQRLCIFEQNGLLEKLPVVVYDCLPERYIDWLKLFGAKKIIKIPPENAPMFKNVWVSSSPNYRGSDGKFKIWHEGIFWLRQKVFTLMNGIDLTRSNRLYLGRRNATWRKLLNEDEVISLLSKYNFICPDMPKLSPISQLMYLSTADIIVGAGGADTILSMFAPTHAINIIMYPNPNMGLGPWGGLGAALFLRQAYVRLDGWYETHKEFSMSTQHDNFFIDVEKLECMIKDSIGLMEATRKKNSLEM